MAVSVPSALTRSLKSNTAAVVVGGNGCRRQKERQGAEKHRNESG
jgi:hypothetical protein